MSVLARVSSSSSFRRALGGIVFALVAATGGAACGGIGITEESDFNGAGSPSASADADANDGTGLVDDADGGTADGAIGQSAGDAGIEAPEAAAYISPLCGKVTSCDPDLLDSNGCGDDDDDSYTDGGIDDDAGIDHGEDAGSAHDGGVDGSAATACRVSGSTSGGSTGASVTASACVEPGAGTDGAACAGGDDCSTGFECVGTPGVCRRYCCSGTCGDTKTFCDVQPASGAGAMSVPVCMPVAPCKLLVSGGMCLTGSTCSVVADDGTTSCVAIGTAAEGAACDTVHCMANEICVGKSGARVCEKLCHLNGDDCSATKVCTGNATLFEEDPTVGICTTPS